MRVMDSKGSERKPCLQTTMSVDITVETTAEEQKAPDALVPEITFQVGNAFSRVWQAVAPLLTFW